MRPDFGYPNPWRFGQQIRQQHTQNEPDPPHKTVGAAKYPDNGRTLATPDAAPAGRRHYCLLVRDVKLSPEESGPQFGMEKHNLRTAILTGNELFVGSSHSQGGYSMSHSSMPRLPPPRPGAPRNQVQETANDVGSRASSPNLYPPPVPIKSGSAFHVDPTHAEIIFPKHPEHALVQSKHCGWK